GDASRSWLWAPLRAAPYKRRGTPGTQTNVLPCYSAPINPNRKPINEGAEARGRPAAPPTASVYTDADLLRRRPPSSTPTPSQLIPDALDRCHGVLLFYRTRYASIIPR